MTEGKAKLMGLAWGQAKVGAAAVSFIMVGKSIAAAARRPSNIAVRSNSASPITATRMPCLRGQSGSNHHADVPGLASATGPLEDSVGYFLRGPSSSNRDWSAASRALMRRRSI